MEKINEELPQQREGYSKPLYTKVVWAGKRKYFFDVFSTRAGEKYISITESRKKITKDGQVQFDNQKLFLFQEDFEKFSAAFLETKEFITQDEVKQEDGKSEITENDAIMESIFGDEY